MRPVPVTQWATPGTNYPAGAFAWSATPVNTTPGISFFTPNVPVPAQYMNAELSMVTKNQIDMQSQVGQLDGVNWGGIGTWGALSGAAAGAFACGQTLAAYDPFVGRWVTAVDCTSASTPRYRPYESTDGQNWSPINTGTMTRGSDGVAVLASGRICITEYDGLSVAVILPGSNSWGEYVVNGSGTATPGFSNICAYQNQFVLAYRMQAGSGAPPTLRYSADGVTWSTGTGTFTNQSGGGNNGGTFVPGASILLLGLKGGDSKYYTSTNGHAWTSRALPNSATTFYDGTYDSATGKFYILCGTTLPVVYLCSSTDGISWTTMNSFLTTIPSNICASGTLLVMSVKNYHNSKARAFVSTDGGVTWRFSNLQGPASGDAWIFASNGTGQFLASDGPDFVPSFTVGLTAVAALG